MNSTSELRAGVQEALGKATAALLNERTPQGWWEGELSSSALSTATAVCALSLYQKARNQTSQQQLIDAGLRWLVTQANADGGWGDTTWSLSNISTTTLVWAAFGAVPGADEQYADCVKSAEAWLTRTAGGIGRDELSRAIIARYGKDRTFSVPILTMCALSGRLGEGREAWSSVIPLPFELAAFSPKFFAALKLPVVSYALPALIAIGQVRHQQAPSRNPIARAVRNLSIGKTLSRLRQIQPSSGGYLEATPLTSFVTMSLIGAGRANHPVVHNALQFLERSARADGSWPIDTNLATWVTTLSIEALGESPARGELVRDWLQSQQYKTLHLYTNAAPGGWAWTDLPGGVPDADDTAGALLALATLGIDERSTQAAEQGLRWLLNLQNRDGGIPTFCRGWGALQFDRSSPDLTAHALRAWATWLPHCQPLLRKEISTGIDRALRYLEKSQRSDGTWIPLWFGNENHPDDENLVYGTARVLIALQHFIGKPNVSELIEAGSTALLYLQRPDGSWGGAQRGASSIEETALAVEALADLYTTTPDFSGGLRDALESGCNYLVGRVADGSWRTPSPIGFYFAKLWYFEKLYPVIFTVAALRKASDALESASDPVN